MSFKIKISLQFASSFIPIFPIAALDHTLPSISRLCTDFFFPSLCLEHSSNFSPPFSLSAPPSHSIHLHFFTPPSLLYATLSCSLLGSPVLCYSSLLGSPVLCYTVLSWSLLRISLLWCAMLCYAMLCCSLLCCALLCYSALSWAPMWCSLLGYAILCYATLWSGLVQGLKGEYYRDTFLKNLALERVDSLINFTWGMGNILPMARNYISIRFVSSEFTSSSNHFSLLFL